MLHFSSKTRATATVKSTLLACTALIVLSSCSTDRGLHLTIHPKFSPITPIQDRQEIQVTWVRSWQPTIYLRVEYDSDDFDREKQIRLSYSISSGSVSKPKTISITELQWYRISESLTNLGFWSGGWECAERAYRERSLYINEMNRCEEIALLDGATISIAATNGIESKGIRTVCNDFETCSPLGALPMTILDIAGLESKPSR